MLKDDSLMQLKEYGVVRLKLKELMDQRGITRNNLARKINTRFEVIDKWYRGQIANMDLDILARICFVLQCSISDVLEYSENPLPEKDNTLSQ